MATRHGRGAVLALAALSIALLSLPPPRTPAPPAANPPPLSRLIKSEAARAGIDPRLIHALISVESSYRPKAVRFYPRLHRKGKDPLLSTSIGLMQVLGLTALHTCRIKPTALFNAEANVTCGIKILAEALAATKDTRAALRYYNGGPKCAPAGHCASAENYAALVLAATT